MRPPAALHDPLLAVTCHLSPVLIRLAAALCPLPTVLCSLIAVLWVTGCGRRETPVAAAVREQVLYLGNGSEPRDLDPQVVVSFNDFNIVGALFEGLTAIDERTSQAVPGVAERWDTSPDGLVWRFHLRPDARWSNGDALTAQDFVEAFRRALSPQLASEYAYALYPLRNAEAFNAGRLADFSQVGVRARDDHTLELTLARPTPYLAVAAALPVWFPVNRASIERLGRFDDRAVPWTRPGNLVGNGPFVLREWSPGNRVVVARNPQYWDADRVRLNQMVFYPIENAATQEAAFRAGQLHITSDVPLAKIAAYRRDDPAVLRIDPFLDTAFLRFNVKRPPLDNFRVRQALARAIDRTALVRDVLLGGQRAAHCLTPPDTAGYTARAAIPDDFAAARRLLAEAGYPGGRGLRRIEIQFPTTEVNQRLLEALQQMWHRELGLEVALANKEQRVWLSDERQLNYDVSFAHWIGDYVDPSTYLELFLSDGGNNSTGWADPAYDQLVLSAGAEIDPAERNELYQQAEARLLDAAPIAPLYFNTRVYLCHPTVRNWIPALLGIHQYKNVYLEITTGLGRNRTRSPNRTRSRNRSRSRPRASSLHACPCHRSDRRVRVRLRLGLRERAAPEPGHPVDSAPAFAPSTSSGLRRAGRAFDRAYKIADPPSKITDF